MYVNSLINIFSMKFVYWEQKGNYNQNLYSGSIVYSSKTTNG